MDIHEQSNGELYSLSAYLLNLSTEGIAFGSLTNTHNVCDRNLRSARALFSLLRARTGQRELATSLRASGFLDAHDPEQVIVLPWDCIII